VEVLPLYARSPFTAAPILADVSTLGDVLNIGSSITGPRRTFFKRRKIMTLRNNERRFSVFALALYLALSAGLVLASARRAGPQTTNAVISIADARNLALGALVTVEGSVTVPSGAFAASTFDQGFAIQDETAGIYVSTSENPNLNFHRRVRVTGLVADDGFGLLILRPASLTDVETLSGASPVRPVSVSTGDVSEATEGRLVEITGTVTQIRNDLPFGFAVFMDDGTGETQVFIPASTGINPFSIPFIVPGARIRVVGFSGQFLTQYEVLPRHRGDIRPAVP
jgi:DNA/RNA endonuclease YhcR with UshA esterase domain